jgi:prophage maintenance system killer protein
VDGNKRVAVTMTAAFLRVNGYQLEFDDLEAFSFIIGLYEGGTFDSRNLRLGCACMLVLTIQERKFSSSNPMLAFADSQR